MDYLNGFVTSFLITLLILSDIVAAQNDVEQHITVTVHPAGQNVELMYTLRQPVGANNEVAGWIIDHSIPRGISFLVNGGVRGYSADLLNNSLIIKNIAMNDSRNGSEYQCVITRTVQFNEQVVESGDLIILHVTGVPGKVPNVTITNSTNGNVVNFTVTWKEPGNHLDPIIMYNVSCSGDPPCPQSYNTINNQTRSYTFTDFTPNSNYTFSVVAINSIGSGEPGVVMVGEITTTTIAPSVVNMSIATTAMSRAGITTTITTTIVPSVVSSATGTTIIASSENMTVGMSSESAVISTSNMMSTIMSRVSISPTMTSSENMTTFDSPTSAIISSTVGTSSISPIVDPSNTSATTTLIVVTTLSGSVTPTLDNNDISISATSDDQSSSSDPTLVIIIIIIVVMIICCCCCMGILFCCCCEKRERQYPDEKLCVDPRCSFTSLVILGVITCGISILVWYMCLKNQSDDKGQDKYFKITNVSIIVLGVYTCGISVLLWWLYKGLCSTGEKYTSNLEDKSAIPLSTSEVKSSKVPSVTNQLAGHNEEVGQFTIPSQTGTIQVSHNEEPVPKNEEPLLKNEEPVPNNDEPVTSVINEMYEDRVIPDGYAVVDTEDVIARRNAAAAAKQDPVQHQTTANGEKYALPNKPPSTKQQGVKYVELERLPTTGRIHTTANDVVTPYAELC